ncbi:diguanylate cyclase [Luteimonas sp. MJ174]|uniref:diguanylate cyclase n=1 Tax=Luteimonas sp. MJ174 TaxID=3129237 RepID=UPI0031B9C5D6
MVRLESHGPEQGLPQSTVNAMVNDDLGFLWVATQDGIARFDGHRFQAWRGEDEAADGKEAQRIVSGSIDTMAFDAGTRRLWLGSNDAGLEILALPDWSRVRIDRSRGLAHHHVNRLALDGAGGAWVGTGKGLDHVVAATAAVTHLGGDAEIVGLAPLADTGTALALGRDCRLWRATRTRLDLLARLPATADDCVALQVGPEGAWAASGRDGLFLLDTDNGQVLRSLPLHALLPDAQPATSLLRRRDGSVLVGFRGGRVAQLAGPAATPARLELERRLDSAVIALHEDPAGALWIGTYTSGLHYARPLSAVVRAGSAEAGAPGGWPRGSMRAIRRVGGHILLGTDTGLFERRPGAVDWQEVPAFAGQSVRAIAPAGDGGWWIGSYDGLWHWPGRGAARAIPGLPDQRIDAMLVESGEGWIGTRGGLARMREGRIIDGHALEPLLGSQVTSLARSDGRLWIGTNADGLWQLDDGGAGTPVRVSPGALHHSLWSLAIEGGALWAGSFSRGVYRIDLGNGGIRRYGVSDGLGSNVVYAVLPDALGRLWVSTNDGLSVIDPASDSVQVLGPRDGLANREYNSSSAFRDSDGMLYFGGTRGIDVLDPAALPRQSPAARPVLTTLRTTPLDANVGGPRETDIVYARQLQLAYRDRMVSISMAAIDFAAPEAAQVRYRVLGLHEDWVYAHAPRAEFSVTDLPPGRYVLEVEAAGRDGRFGEPRRLGLAMAPPWWRHQLAYTAYVLALLALLALVARRVDTAMRRERRQVELLERTVAERTAQLQLANQRLSRTNAQLTIATRRDPLTRISNRRDLQEWLGREAASLLGRMEAADGGSDRLVFLMIDIDDFKRVNDIHGHQAGDEVLVHFADRLRLLSRDDDLLVRWGGEEFLLISRFNCMEHAALLAERIRDVIATQPIRLGRGVALDLSCSIGFAPWPFSLDWPGIGDWSACVGLADRCLYAVKRGRKNGWVGIVPGDAPQPDAIQALLAGAHPDDVGTGTARVLQSDPEPPPFAR